MSTPGTTRLRLLALIPVAAAIAFAVTGCGGSGGTTTTSASSELQSWASSFCTSAAKFKTSVAATRATLHVRNLSRPALQVAVQDLSAATRELTNDLDDLGPPPLPQPDEAKKILADLRADLKEQVDKARAIATNASSTGDVRQAGSNISDALTAATDDVSHAASELRKLGPSGELEQAFKSADSCSSL